MSRQSAIIGYVWCIKGWVQGIPKDGTGNTKHWYEKPLRG